MKAFSFYFFAVYMSLFKIFILGIMEKPFYIFSREQLHLGVYQALVILPCSTLHGVLIRWFEVVSHLIVLSDIYL